MWIIDAGGDAQYVLWPEGFCATFAPRVRVYSSTGKPVASAGDHVDLGGYFGANSFNACLINGVAY